MEEGYEFFRENIGKHRYVAIFGDRRIKRILHRALRWKVLPYPKRAFSPENEVQVPDLDPVDVPFAGSLS